MNTIVKEPNLYDLLYSDVNEDISLYLNIASEYDDILEFGAGTGRITIPLANHRHRVTAVDIEQTMLDKLEEKISNNDELKANIKIINGDMCDYVDSKKYKCIFIPLTSFNYLLTREEQISCLETIKNNLLDGGIAVIELLSEKTFTDTNENDDFKFIKRLSINEKEYYDYYRITKLDLKNRNISQKRLFKHYIDNKFVSQEIFDWNNRFVTIDDFKALTELVGLSIEVIYGNCQLETYNNESEDVFIKLRRI